MKLNILERLLILGILPKENISVATMRIVSDIGRDLGFTEKDYKKYDIKEDKGNLTWNPEGAKEKEFEVGEKATEIITAKLKELSDGDKLNMQFLSLVDKFNIDDCAPDAVTEDAAKEAD